jgi:hypothetical protein
MNLKRRFLSSLAPYRFKVVRRTCLFCGHVADVQSKLVRTRSPRGQERSFRPADAHASSLAMFSNARMDMLIDDVKRRSKVADEELLVMEGVRRCAKCGSKRLENARVPAGGSRGR